MTSRRRCGRCAAGGELRRTQPLTGGSLSQIAHIYLADGREAIVKSGPAPQTEAVMLKAIAASGAPAPAVLAVSGEALVLEAMPADGSLSRAWAVPRFRGSETSFRQGGRLRLGRGLRLRFARYRQRLRGPLAALLGGAETVCRIARASHRT